MLAVAVARPAFLAMETLEGDPQSGLLHLQLGVSTRDGRVPKPEEVRALPDEHSVVCRVGDLMPEDLTLEA